MTESDSHIRYKQVMKDRMEEKGYSSTTEKHLENGLIVDVYSENKEESVAIEIGALNGENRIEKLKEVVDRVIHLPQLDKKKVRKNTHKTVNVKPDTKKLLQKLKIEKDYKNMDELISTEIDFSEVE